ncbi:MAG: hypothetical protein DMG71_01320 [Acidobacteria bacterium]|nr:MAG: hypothetical protein DMG71_01320 [Acidobacteriota bacterium]
MLERVLWLQLLMQPTSKRAGLAFWTQRVREELDKVRQNFEADPVHDLRVALRRCRSMADGFLAVDPDPDWKRFKRLAKELFDRLGDLRDVQVMKDWVTRLAEPDDPVRQSLLESLINQEQQLKKDAQTALQQFNIKKWESLARKLVGRTKKIPLEGLVFQHMAVERWEQARQLHLRALRNRTQVAFHSLRIGLKKFRYTVENFLPQRHAKWGSDLRELQDVLGEIHDLDVLWAILRKHPGLNIDQIERWGSKIREARQLRLEKYRQKMIGRHSLWSVWRAELPAGDRLEQAALARLKTWASFLDPDFAHSKLVTALALQLHDGLVCGKVFRSNDRARRLLEAAALLHDVGRARAKNGHQKKSYRLIRKLVAPLGWTPQELRAVAAIARYHRGALPRTDHKCLSRLPSSARPSVIRLAGVLRLANGFDLSHQKQVRRLEVERKNGTVIVRSDTHNWDGATAERIAAARYLLEASCRVAVLVHPWIPFSQQKPMASVRPLSSGHSLVRPNLG